MTSEAGCWRLRMRLVLVLALTAAASLLLESTHLYATSLVIIAVAIAASIDLLRRIEGPGHPVSRQVPVDAPVAHLQALLDTVNAALLEVTDEGRAVMINRAAHRLARGPVYRLSDIEVLGVNGASRVAQLPPGQSELLQLADGRHAFVSAGLLTMAKERRRLIALQFVSGELDAVEMKAWADVLRVLRHEIMNSLTPIASLSESLAAAGPGPNTRHSLVAIARRSRGLMQFVDRYQRMTEALRFKPETVSARTIVENIERLLATDLAAAGVAASFRLDEPALSFQADSALIEQAVINLLTNAMDAVRATPSPRVNMSVCLSGDEVCISVSDNGCGVPLALRDQIFLPFYTTKQEGSGIGLSLARHIAHAHGGRVVYQPNEPTGSVFQLFLAVSPGRSV